MKKVVLKSLAVISTSLKKARIIEFDEKLTVFTSEFKDGTSINHTGKSLIMKSIYYGLGAKLTKYTKNWKMLNLVTIITFEYNNQEYSVFRCGESFVFENLTNQSTEVFSSVEKLRNFYIEFFDVGLQLLLKAEADGEPQLHTPYPSALFLPFYIDQDVGWDGTWRSFQELAMYKDYRKEIFAFHTGMRNNNYYKLLLDKNIHQKTLVRAQKSKTNCEITIAENLKRFENVIGLNIDIVIFKKEIDEMVCLLNKFQFQKDEMKEKLLLTYNNRIDMEHSLNNINSVLRDLDKDQKYIENNYENEIIQCPMCGSEHKNSITTRYLFQLDIVECNEKVIEYRYQLNKAEKEVEKLEKEIAILTQKQEKISNLLNQKKKNIELRDVLISHGINTLLTQLSVDLTKYEKDINGSKDSLSVIEKKFNTYKKIAKDTEDLFNQYVNANIYSLGITDVEFDEVKKIGDSVKGGGSDLAKIVLAYTLAYYKLIIANDDIVEFPLVIDTMLQQEQSTKSISDMFNFVLASKPNNAQLILATTNTYGTEIVGKVYRFLEKRALLNKDDFNSIEKSYIHNLSLLSDVL